MLLERLKPWIARHRALVMVTLLSLAVRLFWNLRIHPPMDFAYSDMGGYVDRANAIWSEPWVPRPHLTLFPYGTHVFIALVKALFGRDNRAAIGVAFALLGTLAVAYTYATAERFTPRVWVRRLVFGLLVVYYPWISLGGYALSEDPFAVTVAASAYYGLMLADEGRPRDAWLLGLTYGLGATFRPQIIVSAALFFFVYLLRRQVFRKMTYGLWLRVAAPFGLILAISSARLYWHTSKDWKGGAIGLVSTNGPLNLAFGRCHCAAIESHTRDSRGFFGPPALGALNAYGKSNPSALFKLDPAMGETLKIEGYMWDAKPNNELTRNCIKATGLVRQIKYSITNVVLLWGYNFIWPDQGQKPVFRAPMLVWCVAHSIVLLPPMAVAIFLALRKREARTLLLALHVWAVIALAAVYFGDTRYRAPYDGIIIILAFETYARGFEFWRGRAKSKAPPNEPTAPALERPESA
jgi:hypothetical protein